MVMKCRQDIRDVCKFNWIYFILIVSDFTCDVGLCVTMMNLILKFCNNVVIHHVLISLYFSVVSKLLISLLLVNTIFFARCNLVAKCLVPRPPLNGQALYNSTRFGSLVLFQCNSGYKLVGSTTSSCKLRGSQLQWSRQPPTCQCKHCSDTID